MEAQTDKRSKRKWLLPVGLAVVALVGIFLYLRRQEAPAEKLPDAPLPVIELGDDEVVDSIHVATGLKVAEGFAIVRSQCTVCHSGKLVAQNRATREGWQEMIRWMQKTQGLWPLGDNEPIILDYLATNYGPTETGRRANLADVEWYILDLEE